MVKTTNEIVLGQSTTNDELFSKTTFRTVKLTLVYCEIYNYPPKIYGIFFPDAQGSSVNIERTSTSG